MGAAWVGEVGSNMGALTWGGKLGEAVLGPTDRGDSASAAERPAPTACASVRRGGASVTNSRSKRAAADEPVVVEGGGLGDPT